MSFYIHTHSRIKRTAKRIITVLSPFFVGRISLSFMLMLFIAMIGIVYMVNFNSNATMGYQLTRLEYERDSLKTVREQQNINLSRSQSLEYIRTSSKVAGMVPVQQVEYVNPDSNIAYNQ